MPRGKGNPRCEKCEARGIVRAPHGYVVCECVRGKPNRALLVRLAALPLTDFAAWHDAERAAQGLPPFQYRGTND